METRAIFRESAVEAYRRASSRDVLPRLTSWPTVVTCWALLAGLCVAAVLAWSVRVPTYVPATGIVLSGDTAALFVPPDQASRVQPGRGVHARIGTTGPEVRARVIAVEPGVLGPDAVRDRYRLDAGVVTQPSSVLTARLDRPLPPAEYAGSRLAAQIDIGEQRLVGYLPGVGG